MSTGMRRFEGNPTRGVSGSVLAPYERRGPDVLPIGVRPARIQSQQPDALSPEGGLMIRLPGFNFAPAGSIPVDDDGDADIAAGGTATLITIPVPAGSRFRALGIGFDAGDEAALKFLTWSLRINTDTIPGYEQKNAVIGSIPQLATLVVIAPGNTTFTVQGIASASAVQTYRYIARIQGYFYSEKED